MTRNRMRIDPHEYEGGEFPPCSVSECYETAAYELWTKDDLYWLCADHKDIPAKWVSRPSIRPNYHAGSPGLGKRA